MCVPSARATWACGVREVMFECGTVLLVAVIRGVDPTNPTAGFAQPELKEIARYLLIVWFGPESS